MPKDDKPADAGTAGESTEGTARKRLTPEEQIAKLQQEIDDRRVKLQATAENKAAVKRYQYDQLVAKRDSLSGAITSIEEWFKGNNLDLASTKPAPAPERKEKTDAERHVDALKSGTTPEQAEAGTAGGAQAKAGTRADTKTS